MAEIRPAEPPACAPPDPLTRPARLRIPKGACDCHAHVIGRPERYPFVAERTYTPPEATAASYLAMHDALGIQRGVLVQVSVHGTDNRLLLETLRQHPDRLRGVAVVPASVTDEHLAQLAGAGVRALRLNVLFGGGIGFAALEPLARRAALHGLHLELLLDARELPELAPRLLRIEVPFVIDHMGHMPTSAGLDHPGFQTLLGLLRDARAWVKLAGSYRTSSAGGDYRDTIPFAHALLERAPDRLVWGSDWPHVAIRGRMPNDGELLDLLGEWVPDAALRDAILVDNPRRLYRFPQ
jgi:predicted TIM-barrel fold metal-dependent hydrolase